MWCANDMFHYVFKAEFATPVRLKVPSGIVVKLYHKRQLLT